MWHMTSGWRGGCFGTGIFFLCIDSVSVDPQSLYLPPCCSPSPLRHRSMPAIAYLLPCFPFGHVVYHRGCSLRPPQSPKHVSVSCNCHTHIEELGLWNRLSTVVGDVDCVLHLGDQIYADEDMAAK